MLESNINQYTFHSEYYKLILSISHKHTHTHKHTIQMKYHSNRRKQNAKY